MKPFQCKVKFKKWHISSDVMQWIALQRKQNGLPNYVSDELHKFDLSLK